VWAAGPDPITVGGEEKNIVRHSGELQHRTGEFGKLTDDLGVNHSGGVHAIDARGRREGI